MALAPRAVVVHRRTEYDELLAHHGTRGQAEFFLRSRGRNISEVDDRHAAIQQALQSVAAAIPADWRRGTVERADLAHFLFAPDDLVVVVGQDGLVANAAKYLTGQRVIGLNPEPTINPGILVRHPVTSCSALLAATVANRVQIEQRTMVLDERDLPLPALPCPVLTLDSVASAEDQGELVVQGRPTSITQMLLCRSKSV